MLKKFNKREALRKLKKYQMGGITSGETGAEQVISDDWFKPDFAMLDKVLAGKQNLYDTRLNATKQLKAKVNEVNSLEGYDTQRHGEISDELDQDVARVKSLYDGDLSKATSEFEGLVDKVTGLFDIHGEMRAIANRHAGYTENHKKLKEAYDKGDITMGQYGAIQIELARTRDIGIGKNKKQWNSWRTIDAQKAIKEEEFMKTFFENWKSDSEGRWGAGQFNPATGKMEWRKNEKEWISYDQIMELGSQAFIDAASRTGQLEADYNWVRWNKAGQNYTTYSTTTAEQKSYYENLSQNQIAAADYKLQQLQTLQGADLQIFLSRMGYDMAITGKNDPTTIRFRDQAIQSIMGSKTSYEATLAQIQGMSDSAFAVYDQQEWTKSTARRYAHPWASKTAFNKYDEDLRIADSDYLKHKQNMALEYQKHKWHLKAIDYEWKLDNPEVPVVTGARPAVVMKNPLGGTLNEVKTNLSAAHNNYAQNVQGLIDQTITPLFKAQDGKLDVNRYNTFMNQAMQHPELAKYLSDPSLKATLEKAVGQRDLQAITSIIAPFISSPEAIMGAEVRQNPNGTGLLLIGGLELPMAERITQQHLGNWQQAAGMYQTEIANLNARMNEARNRAIDGTGSGDVINWNKAGLLSGSSNLFSPTNPQAAIDSGKFLLKNMETVKKEVREIKEKSGTVEGDNLLKQFREKYGLVNPNVSDSSFINKFDTYFKNLEIIDRDYVQDAVNNELISTAETRIEMEFSNR